MNKETAEILAEAIRYAADKKAAGFRFLAVVYAAVGGFVALI